MLGSWVGVCKDELNGFRVQARVARWFVFKPNIPIWVNFGGGCNGKSWYFYDNLVYFTANGNIYGHLVYFVVTWYILW
jgi:hypothetical protein